MDQVDKGIGGAEGKRFVGPGGFDESGTAGPVNAAEAHGGAVGFEGDVFGLKQDIARRRAAHRGVFVDFAGVVLRIDGCAAGEDGEFRSEDVDQVAERFAVNNPVGVGIASLFTAQAMNEHIGLPATGQFGAQCFRIRGVGNKDTVGFASEAVSGFLRGNQRRDLPSGLAKKIRASLTGVTTAGEEDARS